MNDITTGAPNGQAEIPPTPPINITLQAASPDEPRGPRIVPGCVYTQQDVIRNLGISPNTLAKWGKQENGPKPLDVGSEQNLYLADDIIVFFASRRRA